jgi:drug/metabolite transporter (DMT)-like permease
MQRSIIGILFCLASMLSFAIQDIITKHLLVGGLPLGQLLLVRYLFFTLFAVMLAGGLKQALVGLQSAQPMLQVGRAALSITEIIFINLSFTLMLVAKVHAIVALFPLITLVMARFILKEELTRRRVIAVLIGLTGALIIIQPSSAGISIDLLMPLSGAIALASFSILTKYLSGKDGFITHTLYMGLVGLVLALPFGLIQWIQPTKEQSVLLIALAIMNIGSQLFYIKAMDYADASTLQPFNYTLLLFATLAALILLGEVPTLMTLLGGAIIVVGGLIAMGRLAPK